MFAATKDGISDLFDHRKKRISLGKSIRRIIDLTSPSTVPHEVESRSHKRENRTVPVLVAEWNGDAPDATQIVFGFTKDFSDIGVSLLVPQIMDTDQVVCGFWQDEAIFALGKVARSMPFGGGFWHLGVALSRILDEDEIAALLPMVERLSPRASG